MKFDDSKVAIRLGALILSLGWTGLAGATPHNEVGAGSFIGAAEALPAGTTSVNGTISVLGECDLYLFHVPAGGIWTISMASASVDSNLLLFDGNGYPLAGDDDSGVGVNSELSGFLPAGNYYVGCGEKNAGGYKDMALVMQILTDAGVVGGEGGSVLYGLKHFFLPPATTGPYTLSFSQATGEDGGAADAGDSLVTARRIPVNTNRIYGSTSGVTDADLYCFYHNGGPLTIDVRDPIDAGGITRVLDCAAMLFDASGRCIAADDDTGGGIFSLLNSQISGAFPQGVYYLSAGWSSVVGYSNPGDWAANNLANAFCTPNSVGPFPTPQTLYRLKSAAPTVPIAGYYIHFSVATGQLPPPSASTTPSLSADTTLKAALLKKCKKLKKKLKRATGTSKRRLAKKLRKCKRRLRALG